MCMAVRRCCRRFWGVWWSSLAGHVFGAGSAETADESVQSTADEVELVQSFAIVDYRLAVLPAENVAPPATQHGPADWPAHGRVCLCQPAFCLVWRGRRCTSCATEFLVSSELCCSTRESLRAQHRVHLRCSGPSESCAAARMPLHDAVLSLAARR